MILTKIPIGYPFLIIIVYNISLRNNRRNVEGLLAAYIVGIGVEKMNIYEIAALADVSVSTVSKVINGKSEISETTRNHVLQI